MSYLIINADDFGKDASVTEAIIRAYENQWISQTTLMVNMPYADKAVELSQRHNMFDVVGLHLNLTEGFPLTSGIRDFQEICEESGKFAYDKADNQFRYAKHSVKCSRLLRLALHEEIEAQIQRYMAYRLPLMHCDGHHHVHMRFPVTSILMPLLGRYGFKSIRRPPRTGRFPRNIAGQFRNFAFLGLARFHRQIVVDQFSGWGCKFPEGYSSVEIMTHPRYNSQGVIVDDVTFETPEGPDLSGIRVWAKLENDQLVAYKELVR